MNLINYLRVRVLRRFINLRYFAAQKLPYEEIIRLELLVALCLIVSTVGLSYILLGIYKNIGFLSVVNYFLFFLLAIPLILYLLKTGQYNKAKFCMLITGTAFMVVKAATMGRSSGMNIAMLIILVAIFVFFSIQQYKYILFALFLLFASILFLELSNYTFLGREIATQQYEYEFNLVSTIVFICFFFYVILRVNQYINKKLLHSNLKLFNKNKKLAKINNELDNYIYKASHDIRAPITSLMGLIALLKDEENPEKIKELITLQEKCIDRLDNHIGQILDLSKNVKTELTIQVVDFQTIINEIFIELNFFENAERTIKKIEIVNKHVFYSDEYRIRVILHNLISNSFKYVGRPCQTPEISIQVYIDELHAKLEIKDNGIGIHPSQHGKIFTMFYRGTEISKGSGLGLYIVKEMVDKLKGKINLQSEYGKYTSFIICIPNQINVTKLLNP